MINFYDIKASIYEKNKQMASCLQDFIKEDKKDDSYGISEASGSVKVHSVQKNTRD